MSFTSDANIQKLAEAYALDAYDYVRTYFRVSLDWSDSSVAHIERILDIFHREIGNAKPSEEQVIWFAKMFGSYIGEVFRKNHGASWGIIDMDGHQIPGLKGVRSEALFWPWGRVHNRIVDGAENNIWHYYQSLVAQ